MTPYKLIRSARSRKRTTIRINHEGQVEVRSPRWTPKWIIDRFVDSQQEWIQKTLEQFWSNRPKRHLDQGTRFPFFDQEFPLELTASHSRRKVALQFMGDHFWASIPVGLTPGEKRRQLERLLTAWYKKHCYLRLWQLTEQYCDRLGVKCQEVRIKNHRSRWGSCSSKGNINYNWRLALAPLKVAEYVVVHEVCHLVHHHHQRTFWNLVKSLCPEYKQHLLWLKRNQYHLELL